MGHGHAHREEHEDGSESFAERLFEYGELGGNAVDAIEDLDPEVEDTMGGDLLAGFELLSGLTGFSGGLAQMVRDPSVDAGLKMGKGAKDAVAGGATLVGADEVAEKMGPVGAVLDGVSAINDIRKGDYAHAARDGVSTVLGATAPMFVAPWKVGWAAGEGAEHLASDYAVKHDYYGGKSIREDAMSAGRRADHAVADFFGNETLGTFAGATTAGAVAVGDTVATGARFVGNEIADGAGWLKDRIFGETVEALPCPEIHLDAPEEQIGPVTQVAYDEAPPLSPENDPWHVNPERLGKSTFSEKDAARMMKKVKAFLQPEQPQARPAHKKHHEAHPLAHYAD